MDENAKLELGDEDYVGRNHPPKKHQFQRGRSGNPKGRPRKKPLGEIDDKLFARIAEEPVPVTVNGKAKSIASSEGVLRRLRADAFAGKAWALREWIRLMERYGQLRRPEPHDDDVAKSGVLVVYHAPNTSAEWEERFGGPQPQPTLPILEQHRKEIAEREKYTRKPEY